MYLISRFLLMMAQTREFPTMHVMMSMDVSVVMATSADWDMIESSHASFNDKRKKKVNKMNNELLLW